jgi:hypothetical protein
MSKVARVLRHDEAGEFVSHDRERFQVVWDEAVSARQQREHYVWVEKAVGGSHLERPRLMLFDERGRFLGHADVAIPERIKEFAARFTERYREDLAEMPDSASSL